MSRLSSQKKRQRSVRSDKGRAQLTRRDLDLLRYLGEQTACSFDQIQGWLARHPIGVKLRAERKS